MLTLTLAAALLLLAVMYAAAVSRAHAPTPTPMRDGDVLTRRPSRVTALHESDYTAAELRERADTYRRIAQGREAITPGALRGLQRHQEYAELLDDMACRRQIADRVHAIHEQGLRQRREARPAIRATVHIGALA